MPWRESSVMEGRLRFVARLLEAGGTEYEVSSITGQTPATVKRYPEGVNQRALSKAAILKLERSENAK